MIILFEASAESEVAPVLRKYGIQFKKHLLKETLVYLIEQNKVEKSCIHQLQRIPGFKKIISLEIPYPLVSRRLHQHNTTVFIGSETIGGDGWQIIAGPCSIETPEQAEKTISFLVSHGVRIIRGGLYKPRTSPYSFQGLREQGVEIIRELKKKYSFYFVSEILVPHQMDILDDIVDVWQVGTRSMANYELLKILGKRGKPVLLKRGIMATIEEWLLAAEYVVKEGNPNVILCERGIRTFEPMTRYTFDINAIPVVKELSHLPIVADPSHAVGKRNWVSPLAKAALIAGADGIMVEVHPHPDAAWSDAEQSIDFQEFTALMTDIRMLQDLKNQTYHHE